MQRDKTLLKQRANLVQLAITDHKKAAEKLREMATGLENTRNTSDVVYALTQIFCVSERTILRDITTDL